MKRQEAFLSRDYFNLEPFPDINRRNLKSFNACFDSGGKSIRIIALNGQIITLITK